MSINTLMTTYENDNEESEKHFEIWKIDQIINFEYIL